jgi:uncharacterized protein (TIGR02391 family)
MNIENELEERLWLAKKGKYENRDYKGAVLDAIYFIGDLIREKAALDDDGVALIGQAFGGTNPIMKVNKMQTESDRNEQRY